MCTSYKRSTAVSGNKTTLSVPRHFHANACRISPSSIHQEIEARFDPNSFLEGGKGKNSSTTPLDNPSIGAPCLEKAGSLQRILINYVQFRLITNFIAKISAAADIQKTSTESI